MVGVCLEEAVEILQIHSVRQQQTERCALTDAQGLILAQDYCAPLDNPPFNRSPLDGYALCAISSMGATKETPVRLSVIGEVDAGYVFEGIVAKGQAVRIMTGAPIPEGCDCVIRQEDTDRGEECVALYQSFKPYENFCYQGEDIKKGTVILRKGEKLDAVKLAILASMGEIEVTVMKPLTIGLLCTGDELVVPGRSLMPGKIYNTNEMLLTVRMRELGMHVKVLCAQGDNEETIAKVIRQCWAQVDMMLVTGGVSVGKKDRMHQVIETLGAKRLFWRVAMQPGTPVLAALWQQKLLIGLSGNPFAALVNFELLVRPFVAWMMEDETLQGKVCIGTMQMPFNKKSNKRRFIRVMYQDGMVSIPHQNHASGSLYTMSLCNALVDIPAGTASLEVGQSVRVICL